jgi:hypothetical protein
MPGVRAWQDPVEAVALPVLALAGALLAFGVFVWFAGASPLDAWVLLFKGAFGDAFSWQNTLQRAAPLMLTALAVALPAQRRADGDRRRRRAGAGRAGLRGAALCAARAAGHGRHGGHAGGGRGRRCGLGGAGGLAAPAARRQRDHLQPAAGLHRHRAVQALRRRAAARPGQPEQALHPAGGRDAAHRRHPLGAGGHRRALGPGDRRRGCVCWPACG